VIANNCCRNIDNDRSETSINIHSTPVRKKLIEWKKIKEGGRKNEREKRAVNNVRKKLTNNLFAIQSEQYMRESGSQGTSRSIYHCSHGHSDGLRV
jgi:hypothetical protein